MLYFNGIQVFFEKDILIFRYFGILNTFEVYSQNWCFTSLR